MAVDDFAGLLLLSFGAVVALGVGGAWLYLGGSFLRYRIDRRRKRLHVLAVQACPRPAPRARVVVLGVRQAHALDVQPLLSPAPPSRPTATGVVVLATRHSAPVPQSGRPALRLPLPQRVARHVPRQHRPLWEEKGWRREGAAYVGRFTTAGHSWRGRIEQPYAGTFQAWLWDPPLTALRAGSHGGCFACAGGDCFNVHFHTQPASLDHAITTVETVLHEALAPTAIQERRWTL